MSLTGDDNAARGTAMMEMCPVLVTTVAPVGLRPAPFSGLQANGQSVATQPR